LTESRAWWITPSEPGEVPWFALVPGTIVGQNGQKIDWNLTNKHENLTRQHGCFISAYQLTTHSGWRRQALIDIVSLFLIDSLPFLYPFVQ
jgi:hypothetical protein